MIPSAANETAREKKKRSIWRKDLGKLPNKEGKNPVRTFQIKAIWPETAMNELAGRRCKLDRQRVLLSKRADGGEKLGDVACGSGKNA